LKSGALITAHTACEQDRVVFALPGRIDNRMSAGPHKLIREGASLVTSVQEIVEGLTPLPAEVHAPTLFDPEPSGEEQPSARPEDSEGPAATLTPEPKPVVPVTAQQSRIVEAISDGPTSVDAIVERTTFPVQVVLQELTILSLKGLIQRVDGQTYERRAPKRPAR
jgi:DNA processing protein